jgi:thioredoxin 1
MLSDEYLDQEIKSADIVILKFTAGWCDTCKKYDNYINNLRIKIINIDYDLNEDLVETYEVTKLPTVIIYKNNILYDKIEGFITKTDFIKKLNLDTK